MLLELSVRNFALLEEVSLAFADGLNVLTGETGAGKSIIIDAIGTVLGGRASSEVVRTGADRAAIEATFRVPEAGADALRELLQQAGVEARAGNERVTLAREVARTGRSVARINGHAVPVSTLSQVGGALVDIHGQHEHLSLLRAGAQRDLLDRNGGLTEQRAQVARLVRELRQVRADLRAMQQDEREIARRVDLLSFQIEEIQNAKVQPGEEVSLGQERTRLANAGRLAELAGAVHEALAGGGASDAAPATDLLAMAARSLGTLLKIDDSLADQERLLAEAAAQVEEVAHAVRAYQESIEFNPERLSQVEERADVLSTLRRKYGETLEDVLAFAERAGAELEGLVNREQRTAELEARATALELQIARAAGALSAARAKAGERLAAAVAEEMASLTLKGEFRVAVEQEESSDGIPVEGARLRFDDTGFDTVDFRFAANPGEPARSVARTASGGELSRILLALKVVLTGADRTPTLIFDEVDAGIGGRNGHVVGQKLAAIARQHQVLCVTHLPQIAAFGDAHYFISKHVTAGRTATRVTPLDVEGRTRELAQMLGAVSDATIQQANEMASGAARWKHQRVVSPRKRALRQEVTV
ncbi:MAG TPA: DNA repair protein RecN [Chloroflexota bacterium]|nr:DNA repair protein RecN [Chloroflexota bacterium]